MKSDIAQLEYVDEKLRKMVVWLESSTGFEFTETSLYREGDNGVHGTIPVRGIDLRCRNFEVGSAIERHINRYWVYDEKRANMTCCLLHGKGANLHLHLQVHPNTIFIGE